MHSAALATLSAVPRSMRFHLRWAGIGRQVDRSGAEHEREARRDQRAHDRAHPPDADAAVRLVLAHQHHQRELALADLLAGHERQAVPGRAEHEIERPVGHERVHQRRGVGAHVGGGEAALEDDLAAVERADVERDRPRVDARDARAAAQTSSLAIS